MYRIGFSKDIHRLVENRPLILAGVVIPFHLGELAHSDGDVVYHAISEAVLGALALGDLGKHFPPDDETCKGMDSAIIMRKVISLMKKNGYDLVNLDVHIVLESPRLASYIDVMRKNIANLFSSDIKNISLSAGTNEGVGEVGANLAIEANAIVLLKKV
ncbi:MAG: 2-C-methyl-D-erythritol 2,4-cyclodiphosphate synthase [Bacilli bacterium]